MTCSRCRKTFAGQETKCPHCGQANPAASGTFQTSAVLISSAGADRVYRSVDEVPARLRTRLLRSTNGANSATILIADRRGRKEIARAMRRLPNPKQKRLMEALLAPDGETPGWVAWLTPARRAMILVLIAVCAAALIGMVFLHRW